MGLREAIETDRRGPGGTCPVGILIAGEVPGGSTGPPLEADDREWLAGATGPGAVNPSAQKIHRILREQGYAVGTDAIPKHRGKCCSCFSSLRVVET